MRMKRCEIPKPPVLQTFLGCMHLFWKKQFELVASSGALTKIPGYTSFGKKNSARYIGRSQAYKVRPKEPRHHTSIAAVMHRHAQQAGHVKVAAQALMAFLVASPLLRPFVPTASCLLQRNQVKGAVLLLATQVKGAVTLFCSKKQTRVVLAVCTNNCMHKWHEGGHEKTF